MAFWYVRPDTTHSGTRNGTSYVTAWGGWSEINWGSINAGDTLYVCGTYNLTSSISVGSHAGAVGNRVTISGAYANDPGRIIATQSGGVFLLNARANTCVSSLYLQNFSSNALFITDTATNCLYTDNTFVAVRGSGPLIGFNNTTGEDHVGVYIENNLFTGVSNTGGGSAINWLVGTGINSSCTDVYIDNNTFQNLQSTTARAVVHLRIQNDANVASKMTRVRAYNNRFENFSGVAVEFNSGFSTYNQSQGVSVTNNQFIKGRESTAGVGGCMSLWGFGYETTWGKPTVAYNTFNDVQGAAGFANIFFGSYEVFENSGDRLTTTTIDGNGILFDYGCRFSRAYANKFNNLIGKSGVVNSGVGIMVLDSTDCEAFGNYITNCNYAIHYGNVTGLTTGQSSSIVNNTFFGCISGGVYASSTMDKATNSLQNNIFVSNSSSTSFNNQGAAFTGTENYNVFYQMGAASGHTLSVTDSTSNPSLIDGVPTTSTQIGVFVKPQIDCNLSQYWNPPTVGAFERIRAGSTRT